jgi:hypothetical protein
MIQILLHQRNPLHKAKGGITREFMPCDLLKDTLSSIGPLVVVVSNTIEKPDAALQDPVNLHMRLS